MASKGPIVTAVFRAKDETGPVLNKMKKTFAQDFGDIGRIAGGIIAAEFAQNIVGALGAVATESTDAAGQFELATERIIAASGLTGNEADVMRRQLEDTAKTLGVDYGVGAVQAMRALESLTKAGLTGEDAVDALGGVLQLATIESMDTAEAANLVAQAMTMFGLDASESSRIVDGFVKASAKGIDTASGYARGLANVGSTAASMGMSLEETLAALVQLDNTYGGATQSGTFLNRMLLDMVDKADDAGISLYNQDGSMKSLDEIIGQVRTGLQGWGDDQEAINEWLSQFDTRAQKGILGLAGYDESLATTEESMGEMMTAFDSASLLLDTYIGRMDILIAEQENMKIGVGDTTKEVSLMGKEMTTALGPIGLLAEALGPAALQGVFQGVAIHGVGALITKIISAGGLKAALGGALSSVGGLAASLIPTGPLGLAILGIGAAVVGLKVAWDNNWFDIQGKTDAAINAIKGVLGGLKDKLGGIKTAWDRFWNKMADKSKESSDKITEANESLEYGDSPGGIRDVISAAEEMGSTWNKNIGGMKPVGDLGIGTVPSIGLGGEGAGPTLIFYEGSIIITDSGIYTDAERRDSADKFMEEIGRRLAVRR